MAGVAAKRASAPSPSSGGTLPIGLAHDVLLGRAVRAGETIGWSDVTVDEDAGAVRARRAMEIQFRGRDAAA